MSTSKTFSTSFFWPGRADVEASSVCSPTPVEQGHKSPQRPDPEGVSPDHYP